MIELVIKIGKDMKMFDKNLLVGGGRQDHIVKHNVKINIRVVGNQTIFFTNEVFPPIAYLYNGTPQEMDLLDIAGEILNNHNLPAHAHVGA